MKDLWMPLLLMAASLWPGCDRQPTDPPGAPPPERVLDLPPPPPPGVFFMDLHRRLG